MNKVLLSAFVMGIGFALSMNSVVAQSKIDVKKTIESIDQEIWKNPDLLTEAGVEDFDNLLNAKLRIPLTGSSDKNDLFALLEIIGAPEGVYSENAKVIAQSLAFENISEAVMLTAWKEIVTSSKPQVKNYSDAMEQVLLHRLSDHLEGSKVFPALLEELVNGDEKTQVASLNIFSAWSILSFSQGNRIVFSGAITPILSKFLTHEDYQVRSNAVVTIGLLGSMNDLDELVGFIDDNKLAVDVRILIARIAGLRLSEETAELPSGKGKKSSLSPSVVVSRLKSRVLSPEGKPSQNPVSVQIECIEGMAKCVATTLNEEGTEPVVDAKRLAEISAELWRILENSEVQEQVRAAAFNALCVDAFYNDAQRTRVQEFAEAALKDEKYSAGFRKSILESVILAETKALLKEQMKKELQKLLEKNGIVPVLPGEDEAPIEKQDFDPKF